MEKEVRSKKSEAGVRRSIPCRFINTYAETRLAEVDEDVGGALAPLALEEEDELE